jgi:hypothetical protein
LEEAKLTETVPLLPRVRVTVTVRVPAASSTLAAEVLNCKLPATSSLTMVAVATDVARTVLIGLLRTSKKDSSASTVVSPLMETEMGLAVSPGLKVSVPEVLR